MKYLIIGDVHGCYHTLEDLLKLADKNYDKIIFVGDLIDRGLNSAEVYLFCRDLVESGKAIVLKGNHERIFTSHFFGLIKNEKWSQPGGEGYQTALSFDKNNIDYQEFLYWADALPLCFFEDSFIVSHAGFCESVENREIIFNSSERNNLLKNVDQDASKSMIWSREDCMRLDIPQIHGHTPMPNAGPLYCTFSNVYNLDTGACFGWFLSAIQVHNNKFTPIYIKTNKKDIIL